MDYIYGIFNFKYSLGLSTRPNNYLGESVLWDNAEKMIEDALIKFGKPFKVNKGDGAFYGPKIDIDLYDAFDRTH
jgi:threonyl-tRNA synthetase